MPESTTGITTDEPSIDGQDLTWEGPFTVPGEAILLGSIDLSFSATVSTELPGTYFNNASAQGDGISVTPTGPDAPVTVEAAATGNIVVVKHTDPDGDPQEFSFTTDYTDPFSLSDGEQNDSGDLAAGTYSVSESVPEGWELTSATCDDGSDPSEIGLDDGETVICTFDNTKQGNIVVVKQTNPDGDTQEFGFTTSYSDPFSLSDGEQDDSGFLSPGTYSVSETVPADWDLTSHTLRRRQQPFVDRPRPGRDRHVHVHEHEARAHRRRQADGS